MYKRKSYWLDANSKRVNTGAVPMSLVLPPTPGRPTRRYSKFRRGGNGGPYRALSSGSGHVNPNNPPAEVKYIDCDQSSTEPPPATPLPVAMSNVGAVVCVNDVGPGSANNQRIGSNFVTKSCAYRFEVTQGPTPVTCSGRVILFWDKTPNNAAPAWTTVFLQANYFSFMDVGLKDRFTILRNQQFSLSPSGDQSLFFEGFVKINMLTSWNSFNGTVSVPSTGGLMLAYISDQATVANRPTIAGVWRTRFTDC